MDGVDLPQGGFPEFEDLPLPPCSKALVRIAWSCSSLGCLDGSRWWLSREGIVRCLNCQPPGDPDFIAAQGDASDAPRVEAHATNTLHDADRPDVAEPLDDRPISILRRLSPNGCIEKVEGKGRGKLKDVPADATHWTQEGLRRWVPIRRRK